MVQRRRPSANQRRHRPLRQQTCLARLFDKLQCSPPVRLMISQRVYTIDGNGKVTAAHERVVHQNHGTNAGTLCWPIGCTIEVSSVVADLCSLSIYTGVHRASVGRSRKDVPERSVEARRGVVNASDIRNGCAATSSPATSSPGTFTAAGIRGWTAREIGMILFFPHWPTLAAPSSEDLISARPHTTSLMQTSLASLCTTQLLLFSGGSRLSAID